MSETTNTGSKAEVGNVREPLVKRLKFPSFETIPTGCCALPVRGRLSGLNGRLFVVDPEKKDLSKDAVIVESTTRREGAGAWVSVVLDGHQWMPVHYEQIIGVALEKERTQSTSSDHIVFGHVIGEVVAAEARSKVLAEFAEANKADTARRKIISDNFDVELYLSLREKTGQIYTVQDYYDESALVITMVREKVTGAQQREIYDKYSHIFQARVDGEPFTSRKIEIYLRDRGRVLFINERGLWEYHPLMPKRILKALSLIREECAA